MLWLTTDNCLILNKIYNIYSKIKNKETLKTVLKKLQIHFYTHYYNVQYEIWVLILRVAKDYIQQCC